MSNTCTGQSNAGDDGDDYTNPKKYIVGRTDYRRVPRFPNDGIDAQRQAFLNGTNEHYEFETSDPDQLALTALMGGWMMDGPLPPRGNDSRDFVLSLPWMMQHKAAKEQQQGDLSEHAAKEYLLDAYRKRKDGVKALLEKIGCRAAIHKASRDNRRFPDFRAILVPLLEKQLGSDQNVELLFGRVERVRPLLFDIGADIAQPAPVGSPAQAFMQTFQGAQAAPAPKQCAECGTTEGSLRGCKGCKRTVHYCSKECQTSHWVLHKPDCLLAQGKVVSQSVYAKAEQARAEREAKATAKKQEEAQAHSEKIKADMQAFVEEGPEQANTYSHTCFGKRRRADLPWSAVDVEKVVGMTMGLQFESVLSLGVFPDGISYESYSGRGVLLKNPSNGAKIIVLHERLFADGGEGIVNGYSLDGIFVVDKVIQRTNRAKWRLVSIPSYAAGQTRVERFSSYLMNAMEQSKSVPETVDLGIHNPPDSMFDFTQTANGLFTQVKLE